MEACDDGSNRKATQKQQIEKLQKTIDRKVKRADNLHDHVSTKCSKQVRDDKGNKQHRPKLRMPFLVSRPLFPRLQ